VKRLHEHAHRLGSLLLVLGFWTVVVAPVGMPSSALADTTTDQVSPRSDDQGTPAGAGMQAASFALTIPYGAAKCAFALTGAIVGGLTYVFTGLDTNAAKKVWHTSMYGTYIITPEHLRGEKPVRFLGVPEETATVQEPTATVDAAPAAPTEPIR
jgi:hypothetical protein